MTPLQCPNKIRPFWPRNATELKCHQVVNHGGTEMAILRDYAFPGSETVIDWSADDRRNFTGIFVPCLIEQGCMLPSNHRGECVPV